ncbi:MAG TPA: glycosyl hydrolase 115 family protein [Lacunisphaera sp.]|nr:glycosyl hydrolase 115 family protein [Lacunisphaera sp.]
MNQRRQTGSVAAFLRILVFFAPIAGAGSPWVSEAGLAGDFPLVDARQAASIVASPEDFKVVNLAASDLAADIQRVTGRRPEIFPATAGLAGPLVLVGTVGHSPLIDSLAAAGKIDSSALRGAWECFVIATVADPLPGVPSALVIVGSDRRGTAFGIYELSQAIGVSPWHWWADVTPERKPTLFVAAGTHRFGPPSVKYRGIFINDEDWGLQPWAAKTFEPETGDLGPKTYARVCELLLRLKANTLWPGMHPSTKAFNHFPQNKLVADDHAIVMGSSHAEPMLRNNVGEWTAPKEDYNYLANREGVRAYWEERLKENGRFENLYTLGMRGIHDSNMVGPKTDAERIATLERIFADQRELLAKYARWNVGGALRPDSTNGDHTSGRKAPPTLNSIPQLFCAYKEVLALYRQGLKVPDDVTIVWPDDNFGYVRNFATDEERKRSGGFGVYYHLSYLGAPLSYLWLATTPHALVWEEMRKAYDHGGRRIWIANVGDIKPGEIGMEFFLQMAWDIDRWQADNLDGFLPEWATREFGAAAAPEVARLLTEWYRLNFIRRPEHLQWWLRNETPRPSPWSEAQIRARLAEFGQLRADADRLAATLPAAKRDAFEELVGYPVRGAEIANRRYFLGELGETDRAKAADAELKEATRRFNEEVAGGKWRGIMTLEPADKQFQSMRILPWRPPEFGSKATEPVPAISLRAEQFADRVDRADLRWQIVPGLGLTLRPTTAPSVNPELLTTAAPRLDYAVDLPTAGGIALTVHLLPTHPLVAGRGLRVAVALDDQAPVVVTYEDKDGSAEWAQGVLNNEVTATTRLDIASAGRHVLRLYGVDAGVVVRKVSVTKIDR